MLASLAILKVTPATATTSSCHLIPMVCIDVAEWKSHRETMRVRRFRKGEADQIGRLARKPGGAWFFDYADGESDNESGFRFGGEAFVPGEYVSVREQDGQLHTFRVNCCWA